MLLGAAGFWIPDVLLQAIHAHRFDWLDVRIVTAVMPSTLLMTFLTAKRVGKCDPPKRVGAPMLVGVWLFGGLFMAVGASFSGAGFASPGGARDVLFVLLLSLFPMYTFIMATYDGSLFALLLVTVAAFLIWILQRSKLSLQFGGQAHASRVAPNSGSTGLGGHPGDSQ
jgi:hypothetical protein